MSTTQPSKPFKVAPGAPSVSPIIPPLDGPTSNPNAVSLANFIDDAHAAGYGSMDPNIITTIGHQLGNNNNSKLALAVVKQAQAIPNRQSQFLYEDSAVNPAKTTKKAVQDHLVNTGIKPIPPTPIKTLQQQLIDDGAAPVGAKADGMWNADWSNAQYNYTVAQASKPGFGNFSARGLFNNVFGPGFWSHAIPLVASAIRSIPAGLLEGVATAEKGIATAEGGLGWQSGKDNLLHLAHTIDSYGRTVGGQTPVSLADYEKAGLGMHDLLNIANLALTMSTVGKLGESAVMAVKGGISAGMEAGASNAAKALITKTEAMPPRGPLNWIMNSVMPATENGGNRLAFTGNWLRNAPSAGRFSQNLIESLTGGATDIQKAYKTIRRVAATPYKLPAVAIAGQIGSDVSVAGMKLGLQGQVDNWMGDKNAAPAVALDHLKPIAGLLGGALNTLQIFGHGTSYTADGTASERVGKVFSDANAGLASALNKNGALADWERGTGAVIKDLKPEMVKAGIPISALHAHIWEQLNQFAAEHAAQPIVEAAKTSGEIPAGNHDAEFLFQRNAASVIRHDPVAMEKARESYLLKPQQFAHDLYHSVTDYKESGMKATSKDIVTKLKQDEIMRNELIPNFQGMELPSAKKEDTSWMAQGLTEDNPWGEAPKTSDSTTPMTSEQVIQAAKDAAQPLSKNQLTRIQMMMKSKKFPDREAEMKYVSDITGRNITSRNQLTSGEADRVIKKLAPKKFTLNQAKSAALKDQGIEGRIGYMRNEMPYAHEAENKAMEFAQELQKARPGYVAPADVASLKQSSDGSDFGAEARAYQMPATYNPDMVTTREKLLRMKVMDFLKNELGRNTQALDYVPTQDLIKLIAEKSDFLAHELKLPADAPQALIDAFAKSKSLGYKPAIGQDIGLQLHNAPIDLKTLGIEQNKMTRILDKLGLNFTPTSDDVSVSSSAAKRGIQTTLDAKMAKRPFDFPAWLTGSRLIEYAQNVIKPEPSYLANKAIGFSASRAGKVLTFKGLSVAKGGAWKEHIDALMKEGTVTDANGVEHDVSKRNQAETYLKDVLAADTSPQSWTRKEFIDAMTKKSTQENGYVLDKYGHEVPPVNLSVKDASDLWYAMQKGLRQAPAYQGGFNPLSRMMNSTLGFANVPLAIKGRRIFDVTGDIQKLLIKNRYVYSPRQAYLRVVKSAIKGVNENMPFSMNAEASLRDLSQADQDAAKALTEKVYGENKVAGDVADFATKEFASKDYFNIFNPQAVLERTVHYVSKNMAEEGKAIDTPAGLKELKSRVDAINNYGERSAAEKTLNGFFFPFSFEKTVIRELGSHLLDNPSTRLLTAGAIAAYNSTDGKKMKKWMEDNLPLFKEAEKFNPFYHGTGLGQFGGINRTPEGIIGKALYGGKSLPNLDGVSDHDLLKLFVHMVTPKPMLGLASVQAYANLMPALKDLNNIFVGLDLNGKKPPQWGGEVLATGKDLAGLAQRAIHSLAQKPESAFASQAYQPYALQQTNAWALRAKWVAELAPALTPGAAYAFPTNVPYVGGQKITRGLINKLVGTIYPKWDPNLAKYAQVRDVAITQERGNIQKVVAAKADPEIMNVYDYFTKGSDTIQGEIQKDLNDPSFDPSAIAGQMEQLRQMAAYLAAADSSFPAFYQKYYASKYGPLKGL